MESNIFLYFCHRFSKLKTFSQFWTHCFIHFWQICQSVMSYIFENGSITSWFQVFLMWNKSNIWSISTLCILYVASELHPSLPHFFTILCLILCFLIIFFTADPAWKTADSSKQIAFQEPFTAEFKEVEPIEKKFFLSIYVPCHKKKKLYVSLVFKSLKIQLYDSSINIVRFTSKDWKILSCFVTLLKKAKNIVRRNRKGQTFKTYAKNWNQAE